ncbi:hypothetical protein DPMN_083477 [Dreissena polymorpha]|uniref:Uncharacterized protein n=1 Tax=Dreissena polymorpha TaxID=45954 RepID=A0A9D3Y8U8_DREPO|nr:hypothetical protein DPMN_083477 [Dreissena polymorpha]
MWMRAEQELKKKGKYVGCKLQTVLPGLQSAYSEFFRGFETSKARWWKITEGLQDVELQLHRSRKIQTETPLEQEFPFQIIRQAAYIALCGGHRNLPLVTPAAEMYVEARTTTLL